MATLTEDDLRLFVDAVKHHLKATTGHEPGITFAFLGDTNVTEHKFNGIVIFMGGYSGQILVSMPQGMLRELPVLQHERDFSESNLLGAVGEVANTLVGNARKVFGPALNISVPTRLRGAQGITTRVRQRPYVITFRWNRYPALVCVDLERC